MIKDLRVQLIYRVVLCCVSAFAVLLSLDVFFLPGGAVGAFTWERLKFYTNLSNYVVFVVSVVVTAATARRVLKGETEGYNRVWRTFKFMTVVMILVTFLVVLFLLYDPTTPEFWLDLGNQAYHFWAPLLFVFDFILFDEKGTLSVFAPLYSLILPLLYVGYIFILGATVEGFTYPYFFLNVANPAGITEGMPGYMPPLGYGGVCLWVLILLVVFTVLGYLLWLWNRFGKFDGKWKFDFKKVLKTQRSREE